jgi:hypothetical protein
VIPDQTFDLVNHAFRIANAVIAPEFPLRAETAGKRAAARHVWNRDPLSHGDVDVLAPFEHAPVRGDCVEVLDRRRRGRRHHRIVVAKREALDVVPLRRPAPVFERTKQVHKNLLTLAADDRVDPGRLGQDLLVHEGGMDAAEHRQCLRVHLLG